MNHGLIGARLRDGGGGIWNCVAQAAGQRTERLKAVAPGGPSLRGEGGPIFLPDRGQPPSSACARTERVLDAEGHLAGWLGYGC